MDQVNELLKRIEPMLVCAYLNGFHFNERMGPHACAEYMLKELKHAIEIECILARRRGIQAEINFQQRD